MTLVVGCLPSAPAQTATSATASTADVGAAPTGAPEGGYPVALIAGPGAGPALYRGASAEEPAIGYVTAGVPLELTGPLEGDRAPVRIRGGLKVRGYLVAQRLYARVQRRGRLRGTPIYVAGNDLVRVVGFESDGRVRVVARAGNGTDGFGESYVGTYPVSGLGSEVPAPGENVDPPGTPCSLAGSGEVRVHESAVGEPIASFPAGTPCRLVRAEGDAFAVLVGTGPYVAGYVRQAPSSANEPTRRTIASAFTAGGVPARLRADAARPVVRVASGTRIRFDDTTIAMLDVDGTAQVLERYADSSEADIFIAVDDGVAIRGLVPLTAISDTSP